MSLQRVTPDNFEQFTIETNPSRSYSSRPRRASDGSFIYFTGSQGGIDRRLDNTGSVYVYSYRSLAEKEAMILTTSSYSPYQDSSLEQLRQGILQNTSSNIETDIETYLSAVNNTEASTRKQTKQEIIRFVPPFSFNSNTLRKTVTTDHLMRYYRAEYPTADFSFSNYHSLNFFSEGPITGAFTVPSESALLYPNPRGEFISSGVFASPYGHKEGEPFSFDFWINPKYTTNEETDEYRAGTILHLSSAYAISLVSGSSRDQNNRPDKFRILLQLGSGSGLPPSRDIESAVSGVFLSADNALEKNKWQHVTIRYGGSYYNHGSGSFIIDGTNRGNFSFNSPGFGLYNSLEGLSPDVLCIGNFYEGENYLAEFFNSASAQRDGLIQLSSASADPPRSAYSLSHPLNAEIHDLKIYDKYLTTPEIETLNSGSPTSLNNLKFYLPPFFTEESPYRRFVGEYGGVPVTPFFEENGTSTKPFAAKMAFGCGGHYINLENYGRDFATGVYPRLWNLTGSSFETANNIVASANSLLYSSGANAGAVKKRLYTIMPCDHGGWNPNFNFLSEMSGAYSGQYASDLGILNPGIVTLRDIVPMTDATASQAITTSGSILDDVLGTTPEDPSISPGSSLTILHRLKNPDSNQVVLFDISNLFYGLKIMPGTLTLSDPSLSGSDGKFGSTIKDDGRGNLYRADANGTNATWSSIGNVFYNEGILIIKYPQYYFFGEEGFDINFKGAQNLHIMTINAYARPMQLISSSNPNYEILSASSDLANEPDQRFVYIRGVNFHDENLNVIMRTKLAQPIVKKSGDKMVFRCSLDF